MSTCKFCQSPNVQHIQSDGTAYRRCPTCQAVWVDLEYSTNLKNLIQSYINIGILTE